ncbi:hypothetical protein DVS28_b0360 (plasmid) [Euzebya pacifica]|uniref:Uncharacterized protein n=1 Tax=Euzebya pacifica TaxID=1608957 RepID=A0A346Y6N3_9ACTN|nr:hypothetical protein [Euzebya pacifica]AXV10130.1 hypothetical protein DVS28_b0360 [Euzebya pacifica]
MSAGLTDDWSAVAALLDVDLTDTPVAQPISPPVAGAPRIAADTSHAMRDFGCRRDLRRLLIVIGAMTPDTDKPATGANAVSTDEVIGKVIGFNADALRNLITKAGMISNPQRVERMASAIAAASGRCDRTDPSSVTEWLRTVGAVLRGQD